jgi:sugar-specific transcriptional regulator TrmB
MMKNIVSKLAHLGLSEYDARAYITLLRENPLTAYEIAKNSHIPSSKVYEVIKRLELKNIVQAVHGQRSRMYIPISTDEFIQNFRMVTEDNLHALKDELKNLKTGFDASYTWHMKDYESLLLKARRMLDTSLQTILLSIWPAEVGIISESLRNADSRGVQIAVVHYGPTNMKLGQVYRHPVEDTIFARSSSRGFNLVVDSKEVLIGRIDSRENG